MSLDFPNRKDWLARRYTPRSVNGAVFGRTLQAPDKGTFTAGRNAQKRRCGKGWELVGRGRYKRNTHLRMTALSDRRLRQRSGGLH
jgi:hypothetical protein